MRPRDAGNASAAPVAVAKSRGRRPAPTRSAQRGRDDELRLYGLNAVRAVFARRPDAIRKLYLAQARILQLQPLLAWCVQHRIGHRVVDGAHSPDVRRYGLRSESRISRNSSTSSGGPASTASDGLRMRL